MEEYLKNLEKEKLHREMLKASKDSLFIKDLEDSMKAFETSDTDMTRGTDEW